MTPLTLAELNEIEKKAKAAQGIGHAPMVRLDKDTALRLIEAAGTGAALAAIHLPSAAEIAELREMTGGRTGRMTGIVLRACIAIDALRTALAAGVDAKKEEGK